jgi:hypothetical protein
VAHGVGPEFKPVPLGRVICVNLFPTKSEYFNVMSGFLSVLLYWDWNSCPQACLLSALPLDHAPSPRLFQCQSAETDLLGSFFQRVCCKDT